MNSITKYLNSLGRGTRAIIVALAVIFVSAGAAQAATTITTDITTANLTTTAALTVGTTLGVTGDTTLASTTATTFKVGQLGTQLSQIVAGYCVATVTFTALNTASSTQTYADCTPYTSAGVAITGLSAVTSRVLLQATSSLPFYIILQAASSTSASNIQVALTNISTSSKPANSSIYTFNFMAFQ